ncbi:putative phosphoglycerate mutase (2,3-diphosphoglycerate-dependent) [Helianthus annuus]|uniref:phosphoglycerate mutase (2,3-diphosphoglycerate-dependent) n=2 Tax=Helianthus annuus TaxID=4232 RepID=A0A9K3N902_HELAN|nr:2,3-bisphosphoglycerate-dependent phosphoglycerate mutase isoform X1 [Helianthus annuus]KAF5791195.1 putative phosphoglycerate mutase (2,3-diphosphoglycerate-dependent) [Helianthus annuus]KAJ0526306.1 putative phosphoglycerate mutase (2,3-diphosphoglycerate-dependent) [Helianthus annuus]KAJ0534712.1 putative phosphoglycerate mutase (2,3-diphosphoglycerate-dependent) [Helianthus annuus]KAJ0542697.1 putative phosphoglycerate mutase (2,3-diphosphoglycerate-dependent) [Helianthus annuus]KAJ0707
MALTASQLATGANCLQTNVDNLGFNATSRKRYWSLLLKRDGFRKLLPRTNWQLQISMTGTANHCSALCDTLTSSTPTDSYEPFRTNESTLIIVRHGESMWNEKNLFTGCVDVPLTKKGVEEAIEAGKRLSTMPLDIVYTSALVRSQMTAMLTLTQHCCQKVPIIIHKENEEAEIWSQIYSEDTKNQSIPVVKAWQLNERMYGDLQGLNKQETAEVFGKEQVLRWRRTYEVRPPNGESLEMCLQRAVTYFKENIEPQLMAGKHVMVVAHANSLRSIIMYLDNLSPQEVINLELSTGVPMLYIYKDGKFIRRGSPPGTKEAGVYAYTWNLALYKDLMLQRMLTKL